MDPKSKIIIHRDIDTIRSRFESTPIGLYVASHTSRGTDAVVQLQPERTIVIATINPGLGGLAADYAQFFAQAQWDIEYLLNWIDSVR